MSKSKVLFFMTGSIACYKACHVISRLVQANCDVQVVASPAALQFVGNATIEGLTGKTVVSDLFAAGNVMDHIHLMRWADLILVAPATASFINKAAQGVGDDLLQTLFLAHDFKKPFLLAPAMNTSMYMHPVTQKSLATLREMGLQILDSASGILACGEEGWGRLLEPDLILKETLAALTSKTSTEESSIGPVRNAALNKIKILVTAGGTQEPIDTVRVISNMSSGQTGIKIAEGLQNMGFDVTLLQSHSSSQKHSVQQREIFTSFHSLDESLKNLLGRQEFTHIIHAAAVSDYSVSSISSGGKDFKPFEVKKISSDAEEMQINLHRNHKIVDRLRDYSRNKDLKVVAFKLTSQASASERQSAVQKLFAHAKADYVVHNDLQDMDLEKRIHPFQLHEPQKVIPCENLNALVHELIHVLIPKELL